MFSERGTAINRGLLDWHKAQVVAAHANGGRCNACPVDGKECTVLATVNRDLGESPWKSQSNT